MATQPNTNAPASGNPSGNGNQPAAGPAFSDLPLFRFGLRQLLWFVAVISTLLAGIVSAHGLTALVLLLAAVVVMAHLFATALGSRLRGDADRLQGWDEARHVRMHSSEPSAEHSAKLAAVRAAPRSPWHGRGSTILPWLPHVIAAATVFGGILGALLLALTTRREASLAGIVIGSLSAAVLGGWFAFLCGSFYGVFRHGFREAVTDQQKDESKRAFRR